MRLSELLRIVPSWQDAYLGDRIPVLAEVPLGAFSDRLITTRPYNVDAVVAVPPRRPDQARTWLPMLAFARFRTQYSIIERVAQALAPTTVGTGIIPVIEPLHESDLVNAVPDAPWVRRVLERGAVLYTKAA
jgi:hypothetical protein